MQIDLERSRQYLKQFQFQPLFVEELGWDNYPSQPLSLLIENKSYTLKPVAEKRGQVVYTCLAEDGAIPNSAIRTKIYKEVSRYSLENLLIYIDQGETEQIWQWVRRVPGKPKVNRFHQFHKSQSGDSLLQKLEALAISFEEEEQLTLVDVTSRTRRGFDLEQATTKKFYEQFKKEHGLFLKFITGIHSQFDKEWYCSLMLNRLMFVYFIQKKGFLDGNTDYLGDRLKSCQLLKGQDNFHSFYRYFLLKLFHSGLGDPNRTPELEQILGKVPYLNGGLFEVHQLEEMYPDIQIPDQVFEQVFKFFNEWHWHLDDRPLHNDREINPDVLGYIFEKYINQKQMGAYYTKEDITEYISKNTIIPFLFNAAEKACSIAFQPDGSVWRLLKDNPDRYIYMAMQKGVDLPLPSAISAGIEDTSQRQGWNRPADSEYALPTETWREYVTRRQRCLELRQKLSDGTIHSIDDLISLNLDIRQFAQDVIETCEGAELLRAFYNAICQVSILDPTCGSGAFLFAALNILEPLYDACLERKQVFLDDLKRSDHPHHPETFGDFRQVLDRVAQHPNRRYFILKSIILNNLYGVDIMEEATEICKLRLFLKLVSQVERDPYALNYGLEPLPDIDFNIRAGNTLVGFANYDEVKKAVEGDQQKKLDLFSDMSRIDRSAVEANQAFQLFRSIQTEHTIDTVSFRDAKVQLRKRLRELNQELNRYLAEAYLIGLSRKAIEFEKWIVKHQPFHWFAEFFGVINQGGFDVIVGNPPYVEYSKIKKDYQVKEYRTESCGNLYAFSLERASKLLFQGGKLGFIVPIASVCTDGYVELQRILKASGDLVISSFNDRPGKLFDGLEHIRLCIILLHKTNKPDGLILTTKYNKWLSIARPNLFHCLRYIDARSFTVDGSIVKIGTEIEKSILKKLFLQKRVLGSYVDKAGENYIYYTRKLSGFVQILNFIPSIYDQNNVKREPSELKSIQFKKIEMRDVFLSLLNSNLFYWFLTTYSDCRNLNKREVFSIPFNFDGLNRGNCIELSCLSSKLMNDIKDKSEMLEMKYEKLGKMTIQCIYPKLSKNIINEIDYVLSKHYGFTDEELDFLVNYDYKYRIGSTLEEG